MWQAVVCGDGGWCGTGCGNGTHCTPPPLLEMQAGTARRAAARRAVLQGWLLLGGLLLGGLLLGGLLLGGLLLGGLLLGGLLLGGLHGWLLGWLLGWRKLRRFEHEGHNRPHVTVVWVVAGQGRAQQIEPLGHPQAPLVRGSTWHKKAWEKELVWERAGRHKQARAGMA